MAKGYWKRPITLRLTAYQRKVLSEIVDGALDAGACKDGLSKLESNALTSIFQRLIGMKETAPVEDTPDEPQTVADTAETLTWALCEAAGGGGKGKCDPEHCVCGAEGRQLAEVLRSSGLALTRPHHSTPGEKA